MILKKYTITPNINEIVDFHSKISSDIVKDCFDEILKKQRTLYVTLSDTEQENKEIEIKKDGVKYKTHWKIPKGVNEYTLKNIYSNFLGYVQEKAEKAKEPFYLMAVTEDKLRSIEQNKWWWGQCINQCYLSNMQARFDKFNEIKGNERVILNAEDVHYYIINNDKYGIWNTEWDTVIKDIITGEEIKRERRTSTLSTKQFAELMQNATIYPAENWDVVLELPDFEKNNNFSSYEDIN